MKSLRATTVLLSLLGWAFSSFAIGNGQPSGGQADLSATHFIENKGQVYNLSDRTPNTSVRFMLERPGMKVFLMNDGISTQFEQHHYPPGFEEIMTGKLSETGNPQQLEELRKQVRLETWRVDMRLLGANPNAVITTDGMSEDYTHYYNRNVLFVHHYEKVTYHDIYPGIDWVLYTQEGGMKYDFIVHPGADPGQIRMQYLHHEDMALDAKGNLNVRTSMGEFSELAPVSFQSGQEIHTAFAKQEGDILRFDLASHDARKTLVIDPMVRLWGTYYGGSLGEEGLGTATDPAGNAFLAGITLSTSGIAMGGHQDSIGSTGSISFVDAYLVKFNSAGVRQWGTYYGGEQDEYNTFCATDGDGNVFLVGETTSTTAIASGGHMDSLFSIYQHVFLAKFNSAGVRQWGTYYGGIGRCEKPKVSADRQGNVFLCGVTYSDTNIAMGGHQNTHAGMEDAFLVKFDSAGVRKWATYYGGPSQDFCGSVCTDEEGSAFLCGMTRSTTAIASMGHQLSLGGGSDAYLVKFDSTGVRQWGTYYGGYYGDGGFGVATDKAGNVFLGGFTNSESFISSGGHQNTFGGGDNDAMLVKFNTNGLRLWATYYGGMLTDMGWAVAADSLGNAYLAGQTNSITAIAILGHQNGLGGGIDGFVAKFDSAGVRHWGSYFGGTADDYAYSVATDGPENVYLAGTTPSTSGIASGGHQNTFGGGYSDAFLVKFNDPMVGIPSEGNEISFQLYPNPAHQEVHVAGLSGECTLTLWNTLGQPVMMTRTNARVITLDVSSLASGVYTLRVQGDFGVGTRKLVVE